MGKRGADVPRRRVPDHRAAGARTPPTRAGAGRAHKVGIAQLGRLVDEALIRCDPEEAQARRLAAAEHRHFDVYTDHLGYEGTVEVAGTLDLSDALDLDAAISQGAKHLSALGCDESLDVRRSMAAGELARRQLALDLSAVEEVAQRPSRDSATGRDPTIARYGKHLNSVDQVIAWCQAAGTSVRVQPLIDLNEAIQVGAYEIPDRVHGLVELRDHHCVFPHCTDQPDAATPTTSPPTASATSPTPTTWHPFAGCTTAAPRPAAHGPTTRSPQVSTCGPAPADSGSRPTTPAPPNWIPDRLAPTPRPPRRGHRHAIGISRRP